MINEDVLKATLLALVRLNRKSYEMGAQAMNEIASIRESVRGLDATFADVLSDKREYYRGATDQLSSEIAEEYDSLSTLLEARLIS